MSEPYRTADEILEEDLRIAKESRARVYRRPVLIMGGGAVICADGSVWVFTQNAGAWGWSENPPIPGSRRDAEGSKDLQPLDPDHFKDLEERARIELMVFGIESPTQSQIEARASELEEGAIPLYWRDAAQLGRPRETLT